MRALVLLSLLGVAACAVEPGGRPPRVVAAAQRVLAIDFSPRTAAARRTGIERIAAVLPAELARTERLAAAPGELSKEGDRVEALAVRARGLVTAESRRRPQMPFPPFETPRSLGRGIVAALAALPTIGGLDRPLLGEIDDRRHRTDPHDDHPEKGLWQRLQRRLGLSW